MILTEAQRIWLRDEINQDVNLPILGETAEGRIIEKIITAVEEYLAKALPDDIEADIKAVVQGLEPGKPIDKDALTERLATLANGYVDVPFVGEAREQQWLETIFGFVIKALVR